VTGISYPPHPCAICGREWRAVAFKAPGDRHQKHFCSFECSEVYMKAAKKQIAITKNEAAAITQGGKAAGAYLEQIGKTDLADMTGEEWEKFCATLFETACADLSRQAADHIPF
jgi:hypothetical protein